MTDTVHHWVPKAPKRSLAAQPDGQPQDCQQHGLQESDASPWLAATVPSQSGLW